MTSEKLDNYDALQGEKSGKGSGRKCKQQQVKWEQNV